jgi:hypothetical protein
MSSDILGLVTDAVSTVGNSPKFEERTRFVHWKIPDTNGGKCTIAFRVDTNRENSLRHIEYSIAYCNPNDMFRKAKGRWISEGRLNKNPNYSTFNVNPNERFHEQIVGHLSQLALKSVPPRWATIKAQEDLLSHTVVTQFKNLPALCAFKLVNTNQILFKHPGSPLLGISCEEFVIVTSWVAL